jgi:hypothetical protein
MNAQAQSRSAPPRAWAPAGQAALKVKRGAMRKLAMNFRAILFGADPARLDAWLAEANASSRITTGHSPNKFKTLKRSMFGKRTVCRPLAHSDRRLVGALRLRKSQLTGSASLSVIDGRLQRQHARAQEFRSGPTVHGSLESFQAVDLSFCLTVAPTLCDPY